MILHVILGAVLLYFLIERMAGDNARLSGKRVVTITFGAIAIQIGLSLISKNPLWLLLVLCAPVPVVWFSLESWCGVRRTVALKIAAIFGAANAALAAFVLLIAYALR